MVYTEEKVRFLAERRSGILYHSLGISTDFQWYLGEMRGVVGQELGLKIDKLSGCGFTALRYLVPELHQKVQENLFHFIASYNTEPKAYETSFHKNL